MGYVLSSRSTRNLKGVHPHLVEVVQKAITITRQDFMVIEGVRTPARQAELVAAGKSMTMNSRHLTGHAVDLVAWEAGAPDWNFASYYAIAFAMALAARTLKRPLRWGGCWMRIEHATDEAEIADLVSQYVAARRAKRQKPFLDGPHFELPREAYP